MLRFEKKQQKSVKLFSFNKKNKLIKIRKKPSTFRYDLNKIPYDSTVKVRNGFKGLHLIDRVSDELWMKVCDTVQETRIKTIPMGQKSKKAKWLSGEAL